MTEIKVGQTWEVMSPCIGGGNVGDTVKITNASKSHIIYRYTSNYSVTLTPSMFRSVFKYVPDTPEIAVGQIWEVINRGLCHGGIGNTVKITKVNPNKIGYTYLKDGSTNFLYIEGFLHDFSRILSPDNIKPTEILQENKTMKKLFEKVDFIEGKRASEINDDAIFYLISKAYQELKKMQDMQEVIKSTKLTSEIERLVTDIKALTKYIDSRE